MTSCLLSPQESQTSSANITLVTLMGLPASGKSTLASKLPNLLPEFHVIILSFDNFVHLQVQIKICSEIGQKEDNYEGSTVMKVLRKMFLECIRTVIESIIALTENCEADNFNQLKSKLIEINLIRDYDELFLSEIKALIDNLQRDKDKFIVVVDDNNYYHSMRNCVFQLAKSFQTGYCLVNCKSSLETCLERNSKRFEASTQVPSSVIIEMELKYELPDGNRNLCDNYCLEIETVGEVDLQGLKQFIEQSFTNVPSQNEDRTDEIEIQKRICSESEVHQADIILRKWIGSQLKSDDISGLTSTDKKTLSLAYNQRKKETLELMRKGKFKIEHELASQREDFKKELITFFRCFNE